MNSTVPAVIASFLAPSLVLLLGLIALTRVVGLAPRGWGWCFGLAACALSVLALPVQGLPLARWLAGTVDHWSIPSFALLITMAVRQLFGVEFLRRQDRQAAWVFGAGAGVLLYPLALGLGPFDPFSLGWHFGPLFAGVGIVAVFLHWRRNRFGIVLLLALCAWWMQLPESGNYWDCLLDPFYFLASLGALRTRLWRSQTLQTGASPCKSATLELADSDDVQREK